MSLCSTYPIWFCIILYVPKRCTSFSLMIFFCSIKAGWGLLDSPYAYWAPSSASNSPSSYLRAFALLVSSIWVVSPRSPWNLLLSFLQIPTQMWPYLMAFPEHLIGKIEPYSTPPTIPGALRSVSSFFIALIITCIFYISLAVSILSHPTRT